MQNNEPPNPPIPLIVSENGQGRYQQTVRVGRHTLIADEHVAAGGADAGPAPSDFLLAALGSCTSMTLRMYAERKGLALTRISVALTHEKISIQGLGKVDRIKRIITLEGDLQAEQRTRLLEIANRCPMYRTLCSDIRIDSTLAG
jgi:putative redox protein